MMNDSVGSKSFTAVAINIAAKAGEWIKSKQGHISSLKTKSSVRDLVTEADKGSENMIRKLLQTYFPTHAFLGEESVDTVSEAGGSNVLKSMSEAEYLWIVDPIDGTTNFVHGFPFYAVSIALAHKGEIIVGVIYNPSNDEMFVAEKGKGAYVRGRLMTVSAEKKLQDSLVGSGFLPHHDVLEQNLSTMRKLAKEVRSIRTTGSAALHLAYVAAGRLSGFCEYGLSPWDVAAGALIVQEAGGCVTDHIGSPYQLSTRNVVATNGHIHDELITLLNEDG